MRNTFLLGLAMLLAGPAAAQDQTECFCLVNPATLMIENWGCEARLIESRGIERVRCQNSTFDARETMGDVSRFKRLIEGEGQCVPCYQSPPEDLEDDPRKFDADAERIPEEEPANE